MQFIAKCGVWKATNGSAWMLMRLEPDGHLIGKFAKELGELEQGELYEVTFVKVIRGVTAITP